MHQTPIAIDGKPARSYPRFLLYAFQLATDGGPWFYIWMTILSVVSLIGANAWAQQVVHGMAQTGMNDHVSWGLYIANFTFFVGVAAAAVMMVIPAYLFGDRDMQDSVIVGEILAIAAIVICLLFVVVDLGRPDRMWHMLPIVGRFHWPGSMLTWDVLVLNGYLLINLHICGYLLYCRFKGTKPSPRWYKPFIFLSIIWAVSIHTVTAFLYCGLGGRPFWNTALMAPRFLASAFVAGPAFIIVAMMLLRRLGDYPFGDGPVSLLLKVVRVTCLINLFMLFSEIFTALYTGSTHAAALQYLLVGLHGKSGLVPWFWAAMLLNIAAAVIFFVPSIMRRPRLLVAACVMTFVGIWIEKGMGLIIPGFIPSTLHEMVEYVPSPTEWKVTAGIWAFGLLVFTALLKVAVPVLGGYTPGMTVGDKHIDEQHQELFNRLNTLVRTMRDGGDKGTVLETLGFLDEYTRTHFTDEEAIMQRVGYPGLAGHQKQHAAFIAELEQLTEQCQRDDVDVEQAARNVHLTLRKWLVDHISSVDRSFGEWRLCNPPAASDQS